MSSEEMVKNYSDFMSLVENFQKERRLTNIEVITFINQVLLNYSIFVGKTMAREEFRPITTIVNDHTKLIKEMSTKLDLLEVKCQAKQG